MNNFFRNCTTVFDYQRRFVLKKRFQDAIASTLEKINQGNVVFFQCSVVMLSNSFGTLLSSVDYLLKHKQAEGDSGKL